MQNSKFKAEIFFANIHPRSRVVVRQLSLRGSPSAPLRVNSATEAISKAGLLGPFGAHNDDYRTVSKARGFLQRELKFLIFTFSFVFLILNSTLPSFAEEFKPSLNSIFEDNYKKTDAANENIFVWWLPYQWWQVNLKDYPVFATEVERQKMLKRLKDYGLIFAVKYELTGPYGGIEYKRKDELRKIIRLKDSKGNIYLPLRDDKVDLEVRNFLTAMRTMLADKTINIGEQMYFFVFPSRDGKGEDVADARKEGSFTILLGQKQFSWQLPLSSLLPPKKCPLCKRKFKSEYNYCPYDGTGLNVRRAPS